MGAATDRDEEHAIISTSTILILSGYLLVTSLIDPPGELSAMTFAGGLTGFIAYLVFEATAVRHIQETLQFDQHLAEARLLRHVGLLTASPSQNLHEKDRLLEWLEQETKALSR